MKNLRYYAIMAVTLLASLALNAQSKMTITLKNGSEVSYYISEIAKMTWLEDEASDSINNAHGINNGHEYVDLGLSVKWATCNVGATNPEDYGDYFAWGETTTKSDYSQSNYFDPNYSTYMVGGRTTLAAEHDAARANWGGSWRMPTDNEIDELILNCTREWTKQGGVNGYKVTSKNNGNSIFFPAAGYYVSGPYNADVHGYYWSSSLHESNSALAYYLYFGESSFGRSHNYRGYGRPVRPVCQ